MRMRRATPKQPEPRGGGRSNCAFTAEPLEGRVLLSTLPPGFQETVWTQGFNTPTAQAFAPDGRLFVTEKGGNVRVVTPAGTLLSAPFVSVAPDTTQDRGLVGLAFDPGFQSNRYLYLWWTKSDATGTRNRLSRFTASATSPNLAAAGSEVVLLESPMATTIHTGGAMGFGADGMLYLAVGDGGEPTRAQDPNDLRGKVLRLNVADPANLVPADNPFVGQAGKRPEVWAYGFRNPFTGAMEPGTDTFYVNDVGQEAWEEVNHVQRGGNHGWPLAEGPSSNPEFVPPVYAYPRAGLPTGSSAVTGGVFYTATQFPAEYRGSYFFGDYLNRFTRRLDPNAHNQPHDFGTNVDRALDYDVGPDGSLYYVSAFGNGFDGANRPVYRITWVGTPNRAPTAVAAAGPTSGLKPLTVNFSGAGSSDPDGDPLTYSWSFGDNTTGAGQSVSHTYADDGTYSATLTVSDGRGGVHTSQPVTVIVGSRAPTGAIQTPAAGALYSAGGTIDFSGSATDPEDGTLPPSAFRWSVQLLHNDHSHLVTEVVGSRTGNFTVPTTGHTESNQAYRIVLTVTDAGGVQHQSARDVLPRVADVTLRTTPAGLSLSLDGQPRSPLPFASPSLVGASRQVSAPAAQTVNGVRYEFVGWSDGGAAAHDVTVPAGGAELVATYRAAAVAVAPLADAHVRDGGFMTRRLGAARDLEVKRSFPGHNREAALKFDTAPAAGGVASAKLRVFGRLSDGRAAGIVTDVYGAGTRWEERVVTWRTRPAATTPKLASRSVVGTAAQWYEFDVTNYVRAERAAGRYAVGLLLKSPRFTTPYTRFNAREAPSNKPQLVIVPETPADATTVLPVVTGLTLINADTDQPVAGFDPIPGGAVLDLAALPTRRLNVRADTSPPTVGSLLFGLDANPSYRAENSAPYALGGNNGADYEPWTPAVGAHTLTATAYTQSQASGQAGPARVLRFTVIDSAAPDPMQAPFGGAPRGVSQFIEAEHYDDGGEGVAWRDTTPANEGGSFRTTNAVDTEFTTDAGGGHNVGYVLAGEWLEYTIDVASAGAYDVEVRVAAAGAGGAFHVEFDGVDKTGPMTLPATGGWQVWQTVVKRGVTLPAGRQVMRLAFDAAAATPGAYIGNVNWVRIALPPPAAINWAPKAAAPLARDEAQGVVVGGRLYVFGGFHTPGFLASPRVDVYDPAADAWSPRRDMPEALTHSTAVYDGRFVWLVGGYVGDNPGPATSRVWKYDPAADAWSRGPDLPQPRGAGAAALLGRNLHYFGGMDQARTAEQAGHWVLDVDAGAAWAARAPLPDPRNHLGAAAVGGRVYAVGGQTGETNGAVNTAFVHAYDPAADAWARAADLPAPRSHFNAATVTRQGRIVLVGGESSHNVSEADVWEYDPARGAWSALTPLPAARRAGVAQLVGDAIVVTGGYDGFAHQATTWVGS